MSIFLLDGMAVDTLASEPEEPIRFRTSIPPLSSSGVGVGRRRLLDDPEPLRDPDAQRRVARRAQQAESWAQRGHFEAALMELRDALALDPANSALLHRAAVYASNARDFERAADYFRRLIEVQPDQPEPIAGFASVLLRLARFDEAERFLARVEPMLPDHLVVRFTRLCLDLLRDRADSSVTYWRTRTLDQVLQVVAWLQADRDLLQRLLGREGFDHLCRITLGLGTREHLSAMAAEMETMQAARRAQDYAAVLSSLDVLGEMGVYRLGLEAARAEAMSTRRWPSGRSCWRVSRNGWMPGSTTDWRCFVPPGMRMP